MFKGGQRSIFKQDKIRNRIILAQKKFYKSLLDKCWKGIVGYKYKFYESRHLKTETLAKKNRTEL